MKTRRDFLSKSLLIGASSLLPFRIPALNTRTELPSLKGRTILFTYGGWEGHEPQIFADYLIPWLRQEGAEVHSSTTLTPYSDKDFMKTMDLVIQIYTMSTITPEQEAGLLEAIKVQGTGIAGWHGGLCDSFRNNTEYQYMTGGQWVAHPGGVVDYNVHIVDQKDMVTNGLSNFSMRSEQYYMHIDPNVKVLATTRFSGTHDSWIEGCIIPVTWKKTYGKGRVFYTSLGHNLQHVLDKPEAMTMIKRGVQWASASKYKSNEPWVNPLYSKI
jgi:hypothetical protein